MTSALEFLAELLTGRSRDMFAVPWHTLRAHHTALLVTRLTQRCAPATARHRLAALRGVLKACWQLELIGEAEYRRAIDLTPVQSEPASAGREMELADLAALLAACSADQSVTGIRDYALIALMYNAGLRRSEIVALDWADFDAQGAITVQQSESHAARTVYLGAAVAQALESWQQASAATSGPIFRSISKAKQVQDRRLTDQSIWYLLERRADQAGIAPVRPHDLRRLTLRTMLAQGVDIATVQQIAGHASPATTSHYAQHIEQKKRSAAEGMSLPE